MSRRSPRLALAHRSAWAAFVVLVGLIGRPAEAAVTTYAGCLVFLAAGARKAEGTYPYAFETGFAADLPGLLQTQNLTNLAVSKARMLAEAGQGTQKNNRSSADASCCWA